MKTINRVISFVSSKWETVFKEKFMYLLFGGLTTIVSISVYTVAVLLGINVLVANCISWVAAVSFAYVTNKAFVFDSGSRKQGFQIKEIISFFSGRLITLGMEEILIFVLITFTSLSEFIVKCVSQVLVIVANYFISKYIVFRKAD